MKLCAHTFSRLHPHCVPLHPRPSLSLDPLQYAWGSHAQSGQLPTPPHPAPPPTQLLAPVATRWSEEASGDPTGAEGAENLQRLEMGGSQALLAACLGLL